MMPRASGGRGHTAETPLYGFPALPEGRLRIAFWGDPWLGAMLSRRHHVLWLRPDEAKHVLALEEPHMLLITARADAARSLRARSLVDAEARTVDSDVLHLVRSFRDAGVPVVYHDLLPAEELERFLPAAALADVVMTNSRHSMDAHLAAGIRVVRMRELGVFGSSSDCVDVCGTRVYGHLQSFEVRSSRTARVADSIGRPTRPGVHLVDETLLPVRAQRVGFEFIRRAAWGEASSPALDAITAWIRPWTSLPTALFEAPLRGTLPLLVGSEDERAIARATWPWIPTFSSLDEALDVVDRLSLSQRLSWLRPMLAEVLQSRLIDDWLDDALGGAGAEARAARAFADDDAMLLQEVSRGEETGVMSSALDARRAAPSSTEARSGRPIVRVRQSHSIDGESLRLLGGWARLTGAVAVALHDDDGQLAATWHLDSDRAREHVVPEQRFGRLLSVVETR